MVVPGEGTPTQGRVWTRGAVAYLAGDSRGLRGSEPPGESPVGCSSSGATAT